MNRAVHRYTLLASCAALVAGGAARAEPPDFSEGGFVFSLQYGPGYWNLDRARLAQQIDKSCPNTTNCQAGPGDADARLLTDVAVSPSHAVGIRLGYNIKGHASINVDFIATGWNIFDANRGGGGFLVGSLAWHPMELFFLNKEKRPIGLDVSTGFGAGYGILGGGGTPARGMDGLVLEWNFSADYFFTRFFGLGLFVKGAFLQYDKWYIDYDQRAVQGNTVKLPGGSGGAFWTFGLQLHFRAGD